MAALLAPSGALIPGASAEGGRVPWMLAAWVILTFGIAVALAVGRALAPASAPGAWLVAVAVGSLGQLLPAWCAPVVFVPALAVAAAGVGAATVAMLAGWPAAAAAGVGLALLACACLARMLPGWVGLLAGLAAGGAALLLCRGRHRSSRALAGEAIRRSDRVIELERERDEAERSDQEKSRFLAIASHDLRQPVHALGLFAATLQKRLAQSPDEPLARNLMRAIDALERSFNVMLDVSKLDAGALTPRPHTFPLRDMFRRLHMQFAGQAELAGLGLRFSPGGKSVTSDPQMLERIFVNLIQNAMKHTSRGGVVIVARTTADCVNVEVWDTGCGIAPANLPRIFEEFYQVDGGERDRARGLGMGLAIVKRLSALLGHRLEVASVPGRGTMFRVGVPLGGGWGAPEELSRSDTQPMALESPQVVLVVDDEEPIREGLRLLLLEWGYQPVTAADAEQAERSVQALEGRIDLVLSDLHLGGGPDGAEAIATVRRLCRREVPAILVTGDVARDKVERVASAGATVLFKPVLPRDLFDTLRNTLR